MLPARSSRSAAARSTIGRRTAMGCTAVVVLAGGLLVATPAFADAVTNQDATFSDLSSDLGNGSAGQNDIAQLTGDISGGTITVAPGMIRVLDLDGHTLNLDTLQLTSIAGGAPVGAQLTIVDSTGSGAHHGSGKLQVTHTSDSGTAAIEVDSGSALTIKQAVVAATAKASGTAAAIGGGGVVDLYTTPRDVETAGHITIDDGSVVTATGSQGGAAIGGGRFGGGGVITIEQTSTVSATVSGSDAAAIGSGDSGTSDTSIDIDGTGHNSTGGNGVSVTATATGTGAAIGGGYLTAGGTIGIHDYSLVNATSSKAAIGDGQGATGYATIGIDGFSTVTAAAGSTGGAGIGGSNLAYGSDQVTIGGNSVVSATSANGPGIGGERNRYQTVVNVNGAANVVASGGGNGAGIGGGDSAGSQYQSGAQVTLGDTADLTVNSGAPTISAIGAGNGSGFGNVQLAGGVLHVNSGQQITVPSGSALTNNAVIQNAGSLGTSGSGVIQNQSTIVNTGSVSGTVSGNNYFITYNPGTGTTSASNTASVYADTLQKAQIALPSATPSTPGTFVGWSTAADPSDATAQYVTASSSLSAIGQPSGGSAVAIPLYAIYQLSPVLGSGTLPLGEPHVSYHGSVAATAGTGPITYRTTGSFPAGLVLDASTGLVTGKPSATGTYHFTVFAANKLTIVSHDYTIAVGKPLAGAIMKSVKAKHKFALKLSRLLAKESVKIVQTGPKHASYSGKASKSDVYELVFKHGLVKKGKYTFKVTARGTGRTLTIKLTVK